MVSPSRSPISHQFSTISLLHDWVCLERIFATHRRPSQGPYHPMPQWAATISYVLPCVQILPALPRLPRHPRRAGNSCRWQSPQEIARTPQHTYHSSAPAITCAVHRGNALMRRVLKKNGINNRPNFHIHMTLWSSRASTFYSTHTLLLLISPNATPNNHSETLPAALMIDYPPRSMTASESPLPKSRAPSQPSKPQRLVQSWYEYRVLLKAFLRFATLCNSITAEGIIIPTTTYSTSTAHVQIRCLQDLEVEQKRTSTKYKIQNKRYEYSYCTNTNAMRLLPANLYSRQFRVPDMGHTASSALSLFILVLV